MLALALAAALALLTATAVTWITKRHAAPQDWETVSEILWWTIACTWTYIAFGAAWEGTWEIPVPAAVGLVPGVAVIAFGLQRFAVATVSLGRPPRLDRIDTDTLARARATQLTGLVAGFAGAALAGRSALGLLLAALFALIAYLWVTRLARAGTPDQGAAAPAFQ